MKMNLSARLAGSFVLVLCALMYCETADAGGRLLGRIIGHGSSGGSGGSWGSHGGGFGGGSFGSRGGSWGSRGGSLGSGGGLLGGLRGGSSGGIFRHGSHGSLGSRGSRGGLFRHGSLGSRGGSWGRGSSGGSTGGWHSGGGWYGGSTGMVVGGGSSGGYYSGPTYMSGYSTAAPMTYTNGTIMDSSMMTAPGYQTMDFGTMPMAPVNSNVPFEGTQPPVYQENGAVPVEQATPAGGEAAPADTRYVPESLDSLEAVLEIRTDLETKIFINDKLTRTEGEVRSYVSRNLASGQTYAYHIRAELERDGDVIVREQTVELAAGITESVAFDFDTPPTTTLAIQAPADATIVLCGNEVAGTGSELRMFCTDSLEDGESWTDYDIVVSVERDGRTITREKTIDLSAGETKVVNFDMEAEFAVAAR